jgi:hypothetical protein
MLECWNAETQTVVMAFALEEAEVGEALAAPERPLLDLRDPVGDGHVGDLPVPIELLLPTPVHDGLRHLRRAGRAGSRGGRRS